MTEGRRWARTGRRLEPCRRGTRRRGSATDASSCEAEGAGRITTSPGKIRFGSPDASAARFRSHTATQYGAMSASATSAGERSHGLPVPARGQRPEVVARRYDHTCSSIPPDGDDGAAGGAAVGAVGAVGAVRTVGGTAGGFGAAVVAGGSDARSPPRTVVHERGRRGTGDGAGACRRQHRAAMTAAANVASTTRRTGGSAAQRTARAAVGTCVTAAANVEQGAGEEPPGAQQRHPPQAGDEGVGGA